MSGIDSVLHSCRRLRLQIGGANIAGADRVLRPPTLSSLRDEELVPSLLLGTATRDPGLIAALACLGWRLNV
jgi:hypothetical protein